MGVKAVFSGLSPPEAGAGEHLCPESERVAWRRQAVPYRPSCVPLSPAPAWRGDAPLLKQLYDAGASLDVQGVSRGEGPYGPLEWAERKVSLWHTVLAGARRAQHVGLVAGQEQGGPPAGAGRRYGLRQWIGEPSGALVALESERSRGPSGGVEGCSPKSREEACCLAVTTVSPRRECRERARVR